MRSEFRLTDLSVVVSDNGLGQLPGSASMPPPPAGWYSDPYIHNGLRYWDGYRWTSNAAVSPDAAPVAPTPVLVPAGRRDGVSVTAFVAALFCALPVSIILGFVGLARTHARRRPGRRLAVASLIISGVWIFGLVTTGLVFLIGDAGSGGPSGSPSSSPTTRVVMTDLRSGQCVDLPYYVPQSQDWLDVIDCSVPHNAEVYEVGDLPDGAYPGDTLVQNAVDQLCDTALVAFSGSTNSRLDTYEILPTQDTWNMHDRGYACVAVDDDHDDTGSMANTG